LPDTALATGLAYFREARYFSEAPSRWFFRSMNCWHRL
jgi:hypothetical protein